VLGNRWGATHTDAVITLRTVFPSLLLTLATIVPAHATEVYIQGNFSSGGTLSGGRFFGNFNISFPVGTSYTSLSSWDILLVEGGQTVQLQNGPSGSYGEVFAEYETQDGALDIQFIDQAYDFLDLFFTVPFTGNAPVLPSTPTGYASDGSLDDGSATGVASGIASTTPLPEPGTWLFTGAGLLALGFVVRRSQRIAPPPPMPCPAQPHA